MKTQKRILHKSAAIFTSASMLISCGQHAATESRTQQIIGTDDRVVLENEDLKNSVGYLAYKGTPVCTAFFTAATKLTTALHCINRNIKEYSAFVGGKEYNFDISTLNIYENADVAEISTTEPSISYISPSPIKYSGSQDISVVSYDYESSSIVTDKGAGKSFIETQYNGVLFHELDTIPGSSGSPILQNGKLVAIHLASYTEGDSKKNIGLEYHKLRTADIKSIISSSQGEILPVLVQVTALTTVWCMRNPVACTRIANQVGQIITTQGARLAAGVTLVTGAVVGIHETWKIYDPIGEADFVKSVREYIRPGGHSQNDPVPTPPAQPTPKTTVPSICTKWETTCTPGPSVCVPNVGCSQSPPTCVTKCVKQESINNFIEDDAFISQESSDSTRNTLVAVMALAIHRELYSSDPNNEEISEVLSSLETSTPDEAYQGFLDSLNAAITLIMSN